MFDHPLNEPLCSIKGQLDGKVKREGGGEGGRIRHVPLYKGYRSCDNQDALIDDVCGT